MFVGTTGVGRIIQRACEVMNELGTDDPVAVRNAGAIDLPTLQKFVNFHFSVSVDLFGQELSTNAANCYTMGLKGRYQEEKISDDHRLLDAVYSVNQLDGDTIRQVDQPALTAINEALRDNYITDCGKGVARWNRTIAEHAVDFELRLPHRAFHRNIGHFAKTHVSPQGLVITDADWSHRADDWLPSDADRAFVRSQMTRAVIEPGKMASWIAPPPRGINDQAIDYEYVRLN